VNDLESLETGGFCGDGTWTAHEVPGPSNRGFCGAAYDPTSKRVVIHGGRGKGRITHSDTWSWDGTMWVQLEEDGDRSS
jgi:hypothetical protein